MVKKNRTVLLIGLWNVNNALQHYSIMVFDIYVLLHKILLHIAQCFLNLTDDMIHFTNNMGQINLLIGEDLFCSYTL